MPLASGFQMIQSKLGFSLAFLVPASVSGLMLWQDRGASSNGSSWGLFPRSPSKSLLDVRWASCFPEPAIPVRRVWYPEGFHPDSLTQPPLGWEWRREGSAKENHGSVTRDEQRGPSLRTQLSSTPCRTPSSHTCPLSLHTLPPSSYKDAFIDIKRAYSLPQSRQVQVLSSHSISL